MIKRTICAVTAAAAMAVLAGCATNFTGRERAAIHAGEGVMRVLSVNERGDSLVLRRKSAPIRAAMLSTETYAALRGRMLATVQDPANTGVGIAAPQVGILRRMIAVQRFDKPGEPFEFYLNPKITAYCGPTASGREGCLSVPGRCGMVKRSQQIVVRYRDEGFEERTDTVCGYTAVIFQHETDHLNGILYTDREEKHSEEKEQPAP